MLSPVLLFIDNRKPWWMCRDCWETLIFARGLVHKMHDCFHLREPVPLNSEIPINCTLIASRIKCQVSLVLRLSSNSSILPARPPVNDKNTLIWCEWFHLFLLFFVSSLYPFCLHCGRYSSPPHALNCEFCSASDRVRNGSSCRSGLYSTWNRALEGIYILS